MYMWNKKYKENKLAEVYTQRTFDWDFKICI